MTSFHDAPNEWMEDDKAKEERSSLVNKLNQYNLSSSLN